MKISVIIGFEYRNSKFDESVRSHNSGDIIGTKKVLEKTSTQGLVGLNGIIVDMYLMYKLAKRMKSDKILVITDIEDKVSSDIRAAIASGIVEPDILTFMDNIRTRGELRSYSGLQDLTDILRMEVQSATRLFLYFSGHGKEKGLLMSDRTFLTSTMLRSIIIDCTPKSSQVLVILDCCESLILHLPFTIGATGIIMKGMNIIDTRIIVLSSADGRQSSISTRIGSQFTLLLWRFFLSRNTRELKVLARLIETFSTDGLSSTIRSSYPEKALWRWCFGLEDQEDTLILRA